MSEMIYQEVDFFLTSFVGGMILLAVYDILRIIRRIWGHSRGAVAAEDLLFWAVSGLLVFLMMYEKNDGIMRGTAFFSIGLGMILYHNTIGPYVVKIGYSLIGKPIKKIWLFFSRGLKKVQKKGKLLLKKAQNLEAKEEQHDKEAEKYAKRSR